MVGRHDHVIAGATGQQLAFQGFVGIEDILHRLDASGFFEVGEGGLTDVVRPVINVHRGRRLDADRQRQTRSSQHGLAKYRNRQVGGPLQKCPSRTAEIPAGQSNRRATYLRYTHVAKTICHFLRSWA
ncbi:hypothetical protein D9M71_685460 [compost metagenome]